MSKWFRKLRWQMERRRFRRELAEELALHAELKQREGLTTAEARRAMGNVTLAAEESADVRGFIALEQFMKDVRYALRMFRRQPLFTLVVVLSLALGMAGNTAVFSTVNALLIKPLPFRDPARLERITGVYPKALLVWFRQHCRTMDVAAVSPGSDLNVSSEGPAFRISASATSANLFSLLGAPVLVGRAFEAGEDQPGNDRVAIISHELWATRFQSDPAVIGRVIRVNEVARRIVGVMPAGFAVPSAHVQLWFPEVLDPRNEGNYWGGDFVPLIGRLRPGVTPEAARREVHSLASGLWTMFPWPMPSHWGSDATVMPLQTDLAGDSRARVLILLCAVSAVLVIACANVASLLVARAITRRKEIALRAALGAGRSRIIRQLLTESLLLALIAGALGLTMGAFGLQLFRAVVPADLPGAARITIDWNVAGYTALLSLLAGLSFGLAPALTASRLSLAETVKTSGQRASTGALTGFRDWLVGSEIALTLVLVIGASLLVRSLYALSTVNPGFDADRAIALRVSPDPSFCAQPARCIAFYDRLVNQARGVSGAVDAAVANTVPLDGLVPDVPMDVEDHPKTAQFPAPMFWSGAISPDYLRLMGIPLLAGRAFTAADSHESEPVVLLTESTANRYWPGQSAIGKHVRVVGEAHWRTVVGVVADIRQYNLNNRTPAWIKGAMYMPYAQSIDDDGRMPAVMDVIVRTAGHAPQAADELYRLAAAANPNIPVGSVMHLSRMAGESVSSFRSTTWLFLSFAAVALVLATIGIYGLVSYSVAQRTYEISIRMAIGATTGGILRLVLARSLQVASLATLAGLIGAFAVTRGLAALLYSVAPTDLATYAGVTAFLLFVTALASLVPAWRATRIDPVRTLRAE